MPPLPKPPELRQRRNRATTRATLPSEAEAARFKVPSLPKRRRGTGPWHPEVRAWWRAVFTSPMAAEYTEVDRRELGAVAHLWQQFYIAVDAGKPAASIMAEARQQGARFGTSPIDRRRLQWEVEKGETAQERTQTRRRARELDRAARKDPRDVLKAVG